LTNIHVFAPLASILLIASSSAMLGQSSPTLEIGSVPAQEVTVSPLSADESSTLSKAFAAETIPMQTAFVTLSNSFDKPIVALTTIWTITPASGKPRQVIYSSDSFLTVQMTPVAKAHTRLLLGPTTLASEELLRNSPGAFHRDKFIAHRFCFGS
jgi:hypothetical protein